MVKLNLRGNNIKQAQSTPLITKYVKKKIVLWGWNWNAVMWHGTVNKLNEYLYLNLNLKFLSSS